jgi:hypothetical protein
LAANLGGIVGEPKTDVWKRPRRGLLDLLLGPDADAASELVSRATGAAASPLRLVLPGW